MIPASQAALSGQTARIATVIPPRWLQHYAVFCAFATFLLLMAGSLVTSNKASMSDPTWPLFLGKLVPMRWTGGLLYEDGHRVTASFVGLLTLGLALACQSFEQRRSVRRWAWGAVVLVGIQALIGGLIIKSVNEPWVSVMHAGVSKLFFVLMVLLAMMISEQWMREGPSIQAPGNESLLRLLRYAVPLVYVQLLLGACVRHYRHDHFVLTLCLHLGLYVGLLVLLPIISARLRHEYGRVAPLRRLGSALLFFLAWQLVFGVAAAYANRGRMEARIPYKWEVAVATLHHAGGALAFACVFALAVRAHHLLARQPKSPTSGAPSRTSFA